MSVELSSKRLLGINGLGRIGKLSLWYQLHRRHFDGVVINLGRKVGRGLEDVLHAVTTDSTYGPLERFLHGTGAKLEARVLDSAQGLLEIEGMPVKVLREARDPAAIGWRREGVALVVDSTGTFLDPTVEPTKPALRGHLESGAKVVIASAPFKIKDKARRMPDEAAMLVYGINHTDFDSRRHRLLSAASCTTTALSHMIKPLLDSQSTAEILTASMSTIHAATNTQSVLDSVPKDAASDLRKTRAVFENIILSTTGAANALEEILPAIRNVGFMADSVRVPSSTVSLINLNLTFNTQLDEKGEPVITRELLNGIYQAAAEGPQRGLLVYSDAQNVSADLKGKLASVVIEGHENHTRVAFLNIPPGRLAALGVKSESPLRLPVTHAKVFGWYDNEYGSYVFCLNELAIYVDKRMG